MMNIGRFRLFVKNYRGGSLSIRISSVGSLHMFLKHSLPLKELEVLGGHDYHLLAGMGGQIPSKGEILNIIKLSQFRLISLTLSVLEQFERKDVLETINECQELKELTLECSTSITSFMEPNILPEELAFKYLIFPRLCLLRVSNMVIDTGGSAFAEHIAKYLPKVTKLELTHYATFFKDLYKGFRSQGRVFQELNEHCLYGYVPYASAQDQLAAQEDIQIVNSIKLEYSLIASYAIEYNKLDEKLLNAFVLNRNLLVLELKALQGKGLKLVLDALQSHISLNNLTIGQMTGKSALFDELIIPQYVETLKIYECNFHFHCINQGQTNSLKIIHIKKCEFIGNSFLIEFQNLVLNNPHIEEIRIKNNKAKWTNKIVLQFLINLQKLTKLKKLIFFRNEVQGKLELSKILNLKFKGTFKFYERFNMKQFNSSFREYYLLSTRNITASQSPIELVNQRKLGKYQLGVLTAEYSFGFKLVNNEMRGIYWEFTPDIYYFDIISIIKYFPTIQELKIYPNYIIETMEITNSIFLANLFDMLQFGINKLITLKIYSPLGINTLIELYDAINKNPSIQKLHFTAQIDNFNDLSALIQKMGICGKHLKYISYSNTKSYYIKNLTPVQNLELLSIGKEVFTDTTYEGANYFCILLHWKYGKYKGISPFNKRGLRYKYSY